MVRALVALSLLLSIGGVSAANIEPIITGADMAGIEVTATFADSTSETAVWVTTLTDAAIPDGEGFRGAATGTGWSLAQQGFTLGNLTDGGEILGLWTLTNTSALDIVTVTINALAADVVFDVLGVQNGDLTEYTPGSNEGRGFQSSLGEFVDAQIASYSDLFSSPDLFGTLTIDLSDPSLMLGTDLDNNSILFLADTDKLVAVPASVSALLLVAGLIGFGASRRVHSQTRTGPSGVDV